MTSRHFAYALRRAVTPGVAGDYATFYFPALAIALTMLSFTFLGDGLRDALDPRTR